MHPGMLQWWRARREQANGGEYGMWAACGPSVSGTRRGLGHGWGESREAAGEPFGDGGAFGVRRPLRTLAHKLQLDDKQVGELAKILSELKADRAQGEVDARRVLIDFADAIGGPTFDEAKAKAGGAQRVASAERLREAVLTALGRIHAILDDEQRGRLAYLIRTGTLVV